MVGLLSKTGRHELTLMDTSSWKGWFYDSSNNLAEEGFEEKVEVFGWDSSKNDRNAFRKGKPLFREELMRWDW